jgi:dTDP-4-amino-4,6-dideoxygalactose transaminase
MIVFNRALLTGGEQRNLQRVFASREFSGAGEFNDLASGWLEQNIGCEKAWLTSSCTSALEIIARLLHLKEGDEVIFPAFTHVGTVDPFVKAGATPVWADIRADTLNINEQLLPCLLSGRTKALVAVHYGGVACDLDYLQDFCLQHGLILIEDAAQSIGAGYKTTSLGSFGNLAAISFHQTKNIHCGEGGALLINDPAFVAEAQLMRDRGTNRADFERGRVDRYTWQISGSNYLLSELQAAFLYAQMQCLENVTQRRLALWSAYYEAFSQFLPADKLPRLTKEFRPNGHCFYLLTDSQEQRAALIRYLRDHGVEAVFHYQALHKAPIWRNAFAGTELPVTERVCDTILRLPLHYDLTFADISLVTGLVETFYCGSDTPGVESR